MHARFAILILATATLFACTQQEAPSAPDPQTLLQAIPAASSAEFEHIRDMKTWPNPYLIVRSDGVAIYDVADSAEIRLKPDELLPALAKLPASNWPYGRVVAAAETTTRNSDQDAAAIRRNKGIIGGILEGAHIAVKWVPTT
ncbi:MAG: hypothetical protein ACM3ND_11070 [Acidobacteriota bacterium]